MLFIRKREEQKLKLKEFRSKLFENEKHNLIDNEDYKIGFEIEEEIDSNENLSHLLNELCKMDTDTKFLMKFVRELESMELMINKEISILREKEILRVSKEYMSNDYERRFNVHIDDIAGVIVGERNSATILKRIYKEKHNYYESLKLCRNYNVFHNKYVAKYNNMFNSDQTYLDDKFTEKSCN